MELTVVCPPASAKSVMIGCSAAPDKLLAQCDDLGRGVREIVQFGRQFRVAVGRLVALRAGPPTAAPAR